jgi:hypothetical protein
LASKYEGTKDDKLLRTFQLSGFPTPLPVSAPPKESSEPGAPSVIQWQTAKAFDDCLERVGAERPRTMSRAGEISDFWWFTQNICPWYFLQERQIQGLGSERAERFRKESDGLVDKQLQEWGF